MGYLAKKSFSFLQDFAFISINIETYTNKWNISRKSRFLFCKILHLLVLILKHILINGISRQKSRFPFCKILHLLVLILKHVLINGISREKVVFFCKILHLSVLILKHILINGISREKVVFFFARFCIY